ncbi:MAG: aminopeptidase [Bacteroidales bacterium]|nr:aminopeptidase [Bacteroidales bacterium]
MKKNTKYLSLLIALILIVPFSANAQLFHKKKKQQVKDAYHFTIEIENARTPIKSQGRSSTCWAFSGTSFLESELQRIGKDTTELSVMYTVMNTYREKADRYARWHGKIEFGPGGAFHDVIYSIKKYGIVPMTVYTGNEIQEPVAMHGEMDAVLKGYMDGILKSRKPTSVWKKGFDNLLTAYMGDIPEEFTYKGQTYTPASYAVSLGLNLDDYVEISSFTHHPFYESFVLEVPDNWLRDEVYNVKLDELIEIIDYSIQHGYTVAWGADLGKGFNYKLGVAVVPPDDWDGKTFKPGMEPVVTQERRQLEFDNYSTTDDHGMHFVGIAKDQDGNKYYVEKNSWGEGNKFKGYSYVSEQYVRLKTTDLMVNKNGIPPKLRAKLGL